MEGRFWQHHPDAPFALLLRKVETYCHPEASDDAYDELKEFVHMPDHDPVFDRFKEQLTEAIRDPSQIPEDALFHAAQYSDGTDEKFLSRLWHDLYPDEPLPLP